MPLMLLKPEVATCRVKGTFSALSYRKIRPTRRTINPKMSFGFIRVDARLLATRVTSKFLVIRYERSAQNFGICVEMKFLVDAADIDAHHRQADIESGRCVFV